LFDLVQLAIDDHAFDAGAEPQIPRRPPTVPNQR
jgi:hypothetical protein